jgi:ribonuclease-3
VIDSVRPELDAALSADALKAPKSRLQEWAYVSGGRAPSYRVLSAEGPDHERSFVVEVSLGERVLGSGQGRSRREAETAAAEAALALLATGGLEAPGRAVTRGAGGNGGVL